jgi:hypothetical protein
MGTVKGTVKGKGSGCEKSAEFSLSLSLRQMGEWSSANYNRQLDSSLESSERTLRRRPSKRILCSTFANKAAGFVGFA